ncbi:uncharacterized protein BO80DRAFT_378361 [Aspergillus ibericus CBS 121593]|uniref:DEUBAD domain-containing protein n=1 Tax=Aspergillus ibericus CBS 121593 TaxID=1448316 RepID=A0A395H5E3_9EURO|nr:hypothetical protein BO80DRAFT_378361 [Aspergillus ibericus CBS 121593]RAL02719.1 hypothetical protein BO80DRAFT_378361 [Aspergillus ibericus CBS 121593]
MSPTKAKPKRNSRRAVKDPWEEEQLMTSAKSQLVNLDLVKLLANPQAWDCLEENEKQEILKLLPDKAHPDPSSLPDDPEAKIPPPPQSFLRYSNEWRDGIRLFQLDLENGHYDPEWQRQANQAMQERAAGKFDKFKEEEFEQFWGQKQKLDRTLVAGQSSQVKLKTLTDNGVIQEGDVWRYSRVFSKGPEKILVEKEVRIVKIDGASLSFVMPPGRRVFLTGLSGPTDTGQEQSQKSINGLNADGEVVDGQQESGTAATESTEHSHTSETTEAGSSNKRKSEIEHGNCKRQRSRPPELTDQLESSTEPTENSTDVVVEIVRLSTTAEAIFPTEGADGPAETSDKPQSGEGSDSPSQSAPEPAQEPTQESMPANAPNDKIDEILVEDIRGLTALSAKIIEVDGRVTKCPNGNAWKEFRAYRNNQDMGSLWEVRQAWFQRAK